MGINSHYSGLTVHTEAAPHIKYVLDFSTASLQTVTEVPVVAVKPVTYIFTPSYPINKLLTECRASQHVIMTAMDCPCPSMTWFVVFHDI